MYGVFFQIEALLSLKNAWLPPIKYFHYGFQQIILLISFKLRKNIPVYLQAPPIENLSISRCAEHMHLKVSKMISLSNVNRKLFSKLQILKTRLKGCFLPIEHVLLRMHSILRNVCNKK